MKCKKKKYAKGFRSDKSVGLVGDAVVSVDVPTNTF
jgi:hypothetical protein